MATITLNEAITAVHNYLKQEYDENYNNYLRLAIPRPRQLADGWRFPYDCYIQNYRKRSTMLILFVDKQQPDNQVIVPVVERDTFDYEQILQLETDLKESIAPALPPQTEASDTILVDNPQRHIERIDAVIDYDTFELNPSSLLYWRISFSEGNNHYTVVVGYKGDGSLYVGQPESKSRKSLTDWQLNCMNILLKQKVNYIMATADAITANFTQLPQEQRGLRGHWTAWGCITVFSEFLKQAGYEGIGFYDIKMHHTSSVQDSPKYDHGDGLPTIRFGSDKEGSWSEDPSIVLHELGHALKGHFYHNHPTQIDTSQDTVIDGIEEGLADYFAAMLIETNDPANNPFAGIGGYLPKKIQETEKVLGLPRPVNGKPLTNPPDDMANEYVYGTQWANLIWDFREQVTLQGSPPQTVDEIILSAHLRPRLGGQSDAKAVPSFTCYLMALKFATREKGILFDDWNNLAHKHHIPEATPEHALDDV